MKKHGGKTGLAVIGLIAVITAAACAGGMTAETVEPADQLFKEGSCSGQTEKRERAEKRKAFEEELAKEREKFRRNYEEVKRKNDALRQKFDQIEGGSASSAAERDFLSPHYREWLCVSMYRRADQEEQETLLGQWKILLMNGRKLPERAESWEAGQSDDGRFWVTDIEQTQGVLSLTLHYRGEYAGEAAADLCGTPWMNRTMVQEDGSAAWRLNEDVFVRAHIEAWEGGLDFGGVHW